MRVDPTIDAGRVSQADALPVLLWLLYNILLLTGIAVTFPVLLALVLATPKWRLTFRQRWKGGERHPCGNRSGDKNRPIWIHALSVGEIVACEAIVRQIREIRPGQPITISASTQSGMQTARRLFGNAGCDLVHFPYDLIWSVDRAVGAVNPLAVILVETDIWPNFLLALNRRNIPVYLSNIRLSDKSWRVYRQLKWFARHLFGCFEKIAVQTERDAQRFERIGIPTERICITGNIKFDSRYAEDMKDNLAAWCRKLEEDGNLKVVVAGSTHDGEEKTLIEAVEIVTQRSHATVLILVPRDPLRAGSVLKLAHEGGVPAALYSMITSDDTIPACRVIVVDILGVLKHLYAIADIAFVGGSLVPCGGHNPLEPAAFGKPIVFGPHMDDFIQIAKWLVGSNGAVQTSGVSALSDHLTDLLNDPNRRRSMGGSAYDVFRQHQGAVKKTVDCFGLPYSSAGAGKTN